LALKALKNGFIPIATMLLAVTALLCAAAWAEVGEIVAGFDVIYMPRATTLIFSHQKHSKLDCLKCHTQIANSNEAANRNLPPEEICAECHAQDVRKSNSDMGEEARCSKCHRDYDVSLKNLPARSHWPEINIRHNHQIHAQRMINCSVCHLGISDSAEAGGRHLPQMEVCTVCHDLNKAENSCSLCHLTNESGMLSTRFGGAKLLPSSGRLNHHYDWDKRHAKESVLMKSRCDQCHTQRDCNTCHDGVLRPFRIHPNDYATLHSIDARKDRNKCQSCHRLQSFCVDCHTKLAVSTQSEERPDRVQYHAEGWGDCNPGGTHHGKFAKRNLTGCVSCHREDDCLRCHRSGSSCGGAHNIHGHMSNAQLKRMQDKNPRVCKKCHENL